jgi:hypothetical protein
MNPFVLEGDFDRDGQRDAAIWVRNRSTDELLNPHPIALALAERDLRANSTLSGSPSCTLRGDWQSRSELAAHRVEHPPHQSLPHVPNDLALPVGQVIETGERAVGFLSGELHSKPV